MTKEDKAAFICDLCDNVKAEILQKVDRMPEEWDGIELRQYIRDRYADVVFHGTMSPSRKRKYNNTVLVENL